MYNYNKQDIVSTVGRGQAIHGKNVKGQMKHDMTVKDLLTNYQQVTNAITTLDVEGGYEFPESKNHRNQKKKEF